MENQEQMEKLQKIITNSRNIVAFTGAGVSTESGVPDFRSAGGIYGKQYPHPPEVMVSHRFFMEHPAEFYEFYRREMVYPQARPNEAHRKLAQMEEKGRLTAVITQNIDGLHQAAGSRRVLELHGSIHRNRCMSCGEQYGLDVVLESTGVPRCRCGGIIKPEVVLYEEELDSQVLNASIRAIAQADTLIIGGTSLAVYPAAGLVRYFEGEHLVLINLSPTPMDHQADLLIREKIGEVFSKIELA